MRKARHNCIMLKTKYIHIKIVGKQMNILFKLCEFCRVQDEQQKAGQEKNNIEPKKESDISAKGK